MKSINVLYCFYVHGVDRTKADFEVIQQKTETLFRDVFNTTEEENNEVINLIYGHCSTSHSGSKSRDHLCVSAKNDFIEFGEYLEKTILKELQEKFNANDMACHIYISIVGHSLGGVICRGLIKNIYSSYTPPEGKDGDVPYDSYPDYLKKHYPFLTTFQPCSFLTLSSPHLGARVAGPGKAKSILKKLEKIASRLSTDYLMSYVGKELTCLDDRIKNNEYYQNQHPVLYQFSDKEYMDALAQFPNRTLTGFLRYDVQVKYCTAFACLENHMEDWKKEKETNVFDENGIGTKIIAISGYQEGPEWEAYQQLLYNERVLKDFYYQNTRILEPPNIEEQIKNNLIRNGENPEEISEEELNKRFLTDNENQCDIPVYALKHFNSIPYRRISIDLSLPKGMDRMGTHGQCLGAKWTMFDREFKEISGKTVNFYGSLLVTDFILTSKQQENHTIPTTTEPTTETN